VPVYRSLFLAALAIATCASAAKGADNGPVRTTANGQVRGIQIGPTEVYMGIPYAAPPLGPLRWREPQPAANWTGLRDATRPSNACLQAKYVLGPFIEPIAAAYSVSYQKQPVASSEDCLYLNVWTPRAATGANLPVMVWLHGGSNRLGSGAQSIYDGRSLVSHGVVLVTLNYRLGILGFFAHPELSRESAHHSSGNYALLDQLQALRWVQQNIAQFGGDPRNVTLFGESAGSIDAGMLVVSPLSSDLFQRAILESGPPFGLGTPPTLAHAESVGIAVGQAAAAGSSSSIASLRQLPPEQLTALQNKVVADRFKGFDSGSAVVDGWVLPHTPAQIEASGKAEPVDVMVGINGRELSAFRLAAAALAKSGANPAPAASPMQAIESLAAMARPLYGAWTDVAIAVNVGKILVGHDAAVDQASNDMVMACPVGALAALTASGGRHAFVYRFDRSIAGSGEGQVGAFHSLELAYVFNTFGDPSWAWLPFSQEDRQLSAVIETYWTNFAKTGDPNAPGLARWESWTPAVEPFLEFDHEGQTKAQHGFSPPFCHLDSARLRKQLSEP